MTWIQERRSWLFASIGVLSLVGSLVSVQPEHADAMPVRASKATKAECPLTGKTAPTKTTKRPSVAVRVSNSPDARPQSGVGTADLVVETPVEGGMTRLIVVYHCSSTPTAGPVRSARMDDPAIVTPFSKLFGFSGANAPVMDELDSSGLLTVTELSQDESIFRVPAGSSDVNAVRANVSTLRTVAQAAGQTKPSTRFRFGDVQRGSSVSTVDLDFGSTTVQYRWKSGSWARSQDGATFRDAAGPQVKADNVLVQEVDTNASTSLFDSAGAPSPRFDLVGSGRAFLFRDHRVIVGTWTDSGPGAPVFRTKKGSLMKLDSGRTWLEMVPSPDGDLPGTIAYR